MDNSETAIAIDPTRPVGDRQRAPTPGTHQNTEGAEDLELTQQAVLLMIAAVGSA